MGSGILNNNLNRGEFDPDAGERIDLKHWRSAVQLGLNCSFRAKGGLNQRSALANKARLRRKLLQAEITLGMITAPSGGDPALLHGDGEFVVSNVGAETPLAQVDFGVLSVISVFDCLGFKSNALVDGALLAIETSENGVDWQAFDLGKTITDGYRSRRFSSPTDRSCRYARVVARGFTGSSTVKLKTISIFLEGNEVSKVSMFSRGETIMALTGQHGEIFEAGVSKASLPLDVSSEQISETTSAGQLATLMLYNQQFKPIRIKKQGDDGWNVDNPDFENIPPLSEASALSGVTGPMMSDANGWPACGCFVQARHAMGGFKSASSTYIVSRLGHPFDFQQEFGSGEDAEVTPDAGFEDTISSDEEEIIRRLYVGRHLQIFTDMGEWYVSTRTLDATKPRNVVLATRHGVGASPRLVTVDGGTLFPQEGGGVLRDFFYSDIEQSYGAEPATLWGAHLIGNIVSLGRRRSIDKTDSDLVIVVNDDGTAVQITVMRKQEVFSMGRIETNGKIRSVAVDKKRQVYMAVERTRAGITDIWLEHWDASRLLDASKVFMFDDAETLIGDLDHLEGRSVWAMVDGTPEGPYLVFEGHIELSNPGFFVEVGELPTIWVKLMPHRSRLPDGTEDKKPHRIHTLHMALEQTGELDIRVSDKNRQGEVREVVMNRYDTMNLDTPLMDRLFTGNVKVENLRGWYDAPFVEIFRPVPSPVHIKSITPEVA